MNIRIIKFSQVFFTNNSPYLALTGELRVSFVNHTKKILYSIIISPIQVIFVPPFWVNFLSMALYNGPSFNQNAYLIRWLFTIPIPVYTQSKCSTLQNTFHTDLELDIMNTCLVYLLNQHIFYPQAPTLSFWPTSRLSWQIHSWLIIHMGIVYRKYTRFWYFDICFTPKPDFNSEFKHNPPIDIT